MSIEGLMFSAALRVLQIKDLKRRFSRVRSSPL